MKKVLLLIILSMSIVEVYGQQKESVYIYPFPGKFPGYWMIAFKIVDEDATLVKAIRYDVGFKNKKIKYIQKIVFEPTERYRYEKLDNGNIWVKYDGYEIRSSIDVDYYTSENFRETDKYVYFKKSLPELAEMDNYEMLEYLDRNFTKYYGPKEYRDVPVLKKRE